MCLQLRDSVKFFDSRINQVCLRQVSIKNANDVITMKTEGCSLERHLNHALNLTILIYQFSTSRITYNGIVVAKFLQPLGNKIGIFQKRSDNSVIKLIHTLKLYEGVNISEGEYYKQNEARHIAEHVSFKQVIRKGKGQYQKEKNQNKLFF